MGRIWNRSHHLGIGSRFTPAVRAIVIGTGAVFIAQIIVRLALGSELHHKAVALFGLSVSGLSELHLWQPFTYLLLHDVSNPIHILGNMFLLWMFGGQVEEHIGTRRFVKLYVLGGLFAAALSCVFYGIVGLWYPDQLGIPTIGASGAVCGVMAAFATLFPEEIILLFFLVPIKVKHAVLLLAGLEVLITLSGNSGIATVAHLGGFGFGFLFIRYGLQARNVFVRAYEQRSSRQSERDFEMQERLDKLLAKVAQKGMNGLSWRERAFLKKASKRFRRRHE